MKDLNITNEELSALKNYLEVDYNAINQMLVSDSETDIALLSEDVEGQIVDISYLRENVIDYLKNLKLVYSLILKKYYSRKSNINFNIYRGTNLSEVERLKNDVFIDRMLLGTVNKESAENEYAHFYNRPVCLNINISKNVPYIVLDEVLNGKEGILISPFTKIENIELLGEEVLDINSKTIKEYKVELEKQELDELSDEERTGLYNYILENAYSIKRRIKECIDLEKENIENFENIRKLEQLLNKYENLDYENQTNDEARDDILRISRELEELKEKSNNIFEVRKQNINFVNIWKRNIAVYMIAECKEIEKMYEEYKKEIIDEPKEEVLTENNENEQEEDKIENSDIKEEKEEIIEETEEEDLDKESPLYIAKSSAKENVESAKKLLENINTLIGKQQKHAKIAGDIGTTYSALNNAFEMRKSAEKLLELLEEEKLKINSYEKDAENLDDVEKISKSNLEIGTLFNYLNNPKIAIRNSKVSRFDEMQIIEENELKRNIAEKAREIRGEAELKKLKDDLEIIEDKSTIAKIIGMITGQNKIDEIMIEQIEIRSHAIRKSLAKKMTLSKNYSIHELMAEIKMFIEDNEDDELVESDVLDLKSMAGELKKNYVILDSKVDSIIKEKEGRNLPLNKHISKKEMMEIETYRFLNKYGYDVNHYEIEEPKYQDTMAGEISRIIEYINSSKEQKEA